MACHLPTSRQSKNSIFVGFISIPPGLTLVIFPSIQPRIIVNVHSNSDFAPHVLSPHAKLTMQVSSSKGTMPQKMTDQLTCRPT